MSDIRYSVMVLPRADNKILLRSFNDDEGGVHWDGFGSFYKVSNAPDATAVDVYSENFNTALSPGSLNNVADLTYFIDKPTGLVELHVTVYFADSDDDLTINAEMMWFDQTQIPYLQMDESTGKWLPIVIKNTKLLTAMIKVEQSGDHTSGRVTDFIVN